MQVLNSWSVHFESWVDDSQIHVFLIRYEDLKKDPEKVFRGLLAYLGIAYDVVRMANALEASKFENLKKREQRDGFKEASKAADSMFFRKGVVGSWREELSQEDSARICVQHGPVMRRLGYL